MFIPKLAQAEDALKPTGWGEVASNLMEPVTIVSNFVGTASFVVGVTCIFGAFLRYTQHRKNPLVAPMSTIVLLLVIGIVLIFLPFVYLLTDSGIPFSLF